jgi:hypothetical protein
MGPKNAKEPMKEKAVLMATPTLMVSPTSLEHRLGSSMVPSKESHLLMAQLMGLRLLMAR